MSTLAATVLASSGEPLVRWNWIGDNLDQIRSNFSDHVVLSIVPVIAGLLISLPVGLLCARWPRIYPPILATTNLLYAVPSIAIIIVLLPFTGLAKITVMIPLTFYTLTVLVPSIVDGLSSVPDHVRQAATAMGFDPLRRLIQVELPNAVPVVIAGLRVATVSSISMVTVGTLIGSGNGGLGDFFTDGLQQNFPTPIVVAMVLIVVLALIADGVLLLAQRLLTPWARRRTA
ncbi:MAG: binding-protein-dependent transport system inner rane component [Gemmatimonadales bacterium]|nr:binding-protein-dependent transport system inner rane component [Gemmatimonadales bacterium]